MRVLRLVLLASVLATPALALAADRESEAHEAAEHASGHDDHGELTLTGVLSSRDFQGTVVNFLVLVALLAWVIRTKGNPALAEKRAQVEKELAEAQRIRAEAEKAHMATSTRLEKLDQELFALRADMVKAGEAARDRIVAQAEEKAARMRKDASFRIDQQIKQLREDVTREAASAAVAAAEELLRQTTTESDQDALADAYLARLEEVIQEGRS